MRLRRLVLRLETEAGPHGTELDFEDGLNVLWADNTMGKSTCLRSILYALGFDAMLTTSHQDVPLPPAMKIALESGSSEVGVIESNVFLEIENAKKSRIAIQRTVRGGRNTHLVTVWTGPALTEPDKKFSSTDYYVAWPNAATRERGFHQFLASFLGWKLPEVQTFDGRSVPLYLECIFPFIFVEQMRGWSGLQPPAPTHYRIREVHKRAVEFLLDLDAFRIAANRLALLEEANRISKRWEHVLDECAAHAPLVFGVMQDFPARPIDTWPPEPSPRVMIPRSEKWFSLPDALAASEDELAKLLEEEIPRVTEIANTASSKLVETERALKNRDTLIARLLNSLEQERGEVEAVVERMASLEEDLQRNKDVQTLQKMGSKITASVSDGTCPTCHQAVQDTLTPLPGGQKVMSIDDNIRFIEEQRRTFRAVLSNAQRVVEARERQIQGLRAEAAELRNTIRSLRQTLVSDGRLPSIAAIQSRLQLERSLELMRKVSAQMDAALGEFEKLAKEWKDVQGKIKELPNGDTSEADREKLKAFNSLITAQLRQYGFRSVPPESLVLSTDTYRPEHDGFDLQTSISASDLIRTIWAYLHGLLEVARTAETQHPGLLVFDEPKQQSAKDVSFEELLKRASTSLDFGQQVLFATSEKLERLHQLLKGIRHKYIGIDGRAIQPLRGAASSTARPPR